MDYSKFFTCLKALEFKLFVEAVLSLKNIFWCFIGILVGCPPNGYRLYHFHGHFYQMLCCTYPILQPKETTCQTFLWNTKEANEHFETNGMFSRNFFNFCFCKGIFVSVCVYSWLLIWVMFMWLHSYLCVCVLGIIAGTTGKRAHVRRTPYETRSK